jgi:MoaA/NifB/PqqE/SkfB family radical SAM enzyme
MGQRRIISRNNLMTFDNYGAMIEPLKDYLFQVFLYNWGEPFLNKDIYRIIQFNTSHNISTVVSSNLNIPIDSDKIIECGLDHLVVACDGITQDVYEKYRVGGKIDLVLENLKNIIKTKRSKGARLPYIEWQCLVTKWNEHQLNSIKKMALGLGVDEVRFCNLNFYSAVDREKEERNWLPHNPDYRMFSLDALPVRKDIRRPCFWLWRTATINVDGGIAPCCLFDCSDWGNAFKDPFIYVWNNELYTEARMRSQNNIMKHKTRLVCDTCNASFIYKQT